METNSTPRPGGRSPGCPRALTWHTGLVALAAVLYVVVDASAPVVGLDAVAPWPVAILGLPWHLVIGTYSPAGSLASPTANRVVSEVFAIAPAIVNLLIHALWRWSSSGRSGGVEERTGRAGGASPPEGAWMAALGVATAGCWAGWMAWDRHYDVNPATGEATGPYQPWQVIGCVLCLILVAVLAARPLRARIVVLEMAAVFTAAWSVSAATGEAHGANLWPIGALLVLLAMLGGTALVAGAARVAWHRHP